MNMKKYIFGLMACTLVTCGVASPVDAATLEVSGWIPYWRSATGTADALAHLDVLTEVNPFVYTLKQDGTLVDNGKLQEEPWKSFIAEAKRKKIRVIPTVMSSDKEFLSATLKDTKKRIALEDAITAEVKAKGYDGIDIDFENKGASTNPYFALFLKGLYQRMGNKWVMCTIEARTPPADAFAKMPAKLEYANDFTAINKYCDRVRFMTYDQRTADLTLNKKNQSNLYAPIADPLWVEKAITLAAKQIKKNKIMIGIATYGYEYDVTGTLGDYSYDILWSFNPKYATQMQSLYGINPIRNTAGEMSMTYVSTSSPLQINIDVYRANLVPEDNGNGNAALAGMSVSSSSVNRLPLNFRYLVWSDARSIYDKMALAKRLGVRGVSIFKIDGGEDPRMWDVIQQTR